MPVAEVLQYAVEGQLDQIPPPGVALQAQLLQKDGRRREQDAQANGREEEGQGLIEYALIAGFISIICWAVIQTTGQSVSTIWDTVQAAVSAAA